jgi:hypothetical protein
LELFTVAEISFKPAKGGDLHILSEVAVERGALLPSTYSTLLSAAYFAELCDLFTEPMHPVPEVFALLERAWGFLRGQSPSRRAVTYFETELAKSLGIYDPSVPAHRSLASVAHKLPESRPRLMEHLADSP